MSAPVIHARFHLARPGFTLSVALELPGRGVTALFGPSGSGKTSLLRCIAGLERAEGLLQVGDDTWQDSQRRLFLPTHRRPLGYVFQQANLFGHLSVRDNLLFGHRRIAPRERKVLLEQAVELLELAPLLERMPAGLSGGEQQRVGIARALLTSPRLLLMDEPLAALDVRRKAEILPYLERMHGQLEIPLLYVSHAPDEVARLADHLVLLERGQAIASGPLNETLARLDLPLAREDDAGVVIEGRVAAYEARYSLLSLQLPGSALSVRLVHGAMPAGAALRLRIRARDVSLALRPPEQSSILNVLPATVIQIATADQPDHVLVRLAVDGTPLLARLTRYSCDRLAVQPGRQLWAQIKAVALLS
jgi:molybdate transport system ATP-binding protein